ncbi:hypothetical protein D3C72_2078240 [compost metagenome]
MQIADGVGVPGAVGALVQPHGPQGHPIAGFPDPFGGLDDFFFRNSGNCGDFDRRIVFQECRQAVEARCIGLNELMVGITILHDQVQKTVKQSQVRTRIDPQI